jgi:molybdopterin biosynthesis enzyme MoaB
MSKGEINVLTARDTRYKKLDKNGHILYRQIVGKLMYTMVRSRPDLTYSLSVLGRYAASPDTYHIALAKQVLAYVKVTINYRLHYSRESDKSTAILTDWVDSDYTNSNNQKSTTGLCFFVENTLVYWCSKRQVIIATSTTVAEYFTFYKATTECICLRNLITDIGLSQIGPTPKPQN